MRYLSHVIFLLWLSFTTVQAQVFPVNVTTTLRPPYTLNLSDYASPTYDRIQANIFMADLTKVNYPAKVRLVIRGAGGINISTIPGQEIGPIFLNGGQSLLLTSTELSQLFNPQKLQFSGISQQQYQKNSALPEGIYQFQFEVLDFNFNIAVSNVNSGFATAWLILNDPPIINKPEMNSTVVPKNPQNIFFQWTPRHTGSPNSAKSVEYDIQLVEIIPSGRNPNDAMLTSPPIFDKTVITTSYNFTVMDPYLFPGRWYAFRVRAKDQNGLDLFKNQGYSEVFQFYYGEDCPIPANIAVEQTDVTSVLVQWTQQLAHVSADVQYKVKSDKSWKTATTFKNSAIINDLTPGEEYVFRVVAKCENNSSLISDEVPLTMEAGGQPTCMAPEFFQADQLALKDPKQDVRLTWFPLPEVKEYNIYVESSAGIEKYTVKATDYAANSDNKYYNKDFTVENKPFYVTFEVKCANGSYNKGEKKLVDLSKGTFSAGCSAPLSESLSAVAKDLETVSISWSTASWFTDYRLRYRVLGDPLFIEVETKDPNTELSKLDLDKLYEYQIIYHCKSGEWAEGAFNVFKITVPANVVNPATATGTGSCFPPSAVRAQVNADLSATITWPKDKDVAGYRVFWKLKDDKLAPWDSISVTTNEATIKNLSPKTEYDYKVKSVCKAGGLSIPNLTQSFNTAEIYTYTGPCEAPILKGVAITPNLEARIDWEPRSYYTGYLLEYREKSKQWVSIKTSKPTELVSYLSKTVTYEYHVQAYCGIKESDFSKTDTFSLNRKVEDNFACGKDGMVKLTSTTPIAALKVGDKFNAADFELEIKSLTSERPYNGIAFAQIPYLKHSTFEFVMQNVWVNETGQMYNGKVILKGAYLRAIDPALADKINSFVDKLDKGLSMASNILTMADSIQTALNDVIQTSNQPVDWKKYEGWTADQLYAEGQRLAAEAKAMFSNGMPSSIAQAKQMLMESIELIKMAAALGHAGVQVVSEKMKGWLGDILEKVKTKATTNKETAEKNLVTVEPKVDEEYTKTQDPNLAKQDVLPSDVAVGNIDTNPTAADKNKKAALSSDKNLGDLYKDYKDYTTNEYNLQTYNKILGYIDYFSKDANAAVLVQQIQTDLKDVIKGRKLDDIPEADMKELVAAIEKYIQDYFEKKANEESTNAK